MNSSVLLSCSSGYARLARGVFLLGLLCPPLHSASPESEAVTPRPSPWQVAATTVLDGSRSLAGTPSSRTAVRGLLDVALTVKPGNSPAGEPFVQGYAQFLAFRGRNESADLGWLQGQSNIDAEAMKRIGELWTELRPWAGQVRLKFGQLDGSTEFAAAASAGDFLNSSAGTSPAVFRLPAYPEPTLGFNGFVQASDSLQVGLGCYGDALRAVSGHGFRRPLWVAEAAYSGRHALGRGRLALGAWHDRHEFERTDGTRAAGARGWYALAEQPLWEAAGSTTEAPRAVTLFWQYGRAPAAISPVARHLAFGLNAAGLWPARAADTTGIYWSRALPGQQALPGETAHETVVEVYYKFQFRPWLNLQPDLQWVRHPGGAKTADDALVVMLRSTASF